MGYNAQMMDKMFAKMSENLEEKFKKNPEFAFLRQKYEQEKGIKIHDRGEVEAEETLYN